MTRSTFLLPEDELCEIAAQYRYEAETQKFIPVGPEIQSYKLGSAYESGGAGGVSTVEDYIRFQEGLRTGKLLGPETLKMMYTPQINNSNPMEYAYGLGVRCPSTGSVLQDFGWDGAAGSFTAIMPEAEATLFYGQHVLSSPHLPFKFELARAMKDDLK